VAEEVQCQVSAAVDLLRNELLEAAAAIAKRSAAEVHEQGDQEIRELLDATRHALAEEVQALETRREGSAEGRHGGGAGAEAAPTEDAALRGGPEVDTSEALEGELLRDRQAGLLRNLSGKLQVAQGMEASVASLQELLQAHGQVVAKVQAKTAEQEEQVRVMGAQLAEMVWTLGESFRRQVTALETQHGQQSARGEDIMKGSIVRCDTLAEQVSSERHLRVAANEQLAKLLKDEITVAEAKQQEVIVQGMEHCLVQSKEMVAQLQIEQMAQHEAQAEELERMRCELQREQKAKTAECSHQIAAVQAQHEAQAEELERVRFELQREQKAQTAVCTHQMAVVKENLTIALQDQAHCLMQQAMQANSALQAEITARRLEAEDLQTQVESLRSTVPSQIRQAVRLAQEQQEAQVRLLAEDSDYKSQQIFRQFQADSETREQMTREIQAWSDHCTRLKHEIVGLEKAIQGCNTQSAKHARDAEMDVARVEGDIRRDGMIVPGLVGTAAVAAAFLL